jgi:hypothetical protein
MAKTFMAGVAIDPIGLSIQNDNLLREAGLGWMRTGVRGFNQDRFFAGESQSEHYYQTREKFIELRKTGFQIMGITPGCKGLSAAAGPIGSPEYFENYRRLCAFLGREFAGLIDYWQVANELDIWIFRDELTLEQSADFLRAGVRGIKDASRDLKVGINITLFPSKPGEVDGNTDKHEGVFLAKSIYSDLTLELDYAGLDSYPGTWREGGADSWHGYLESFHQLTGKPIIIQEFGYSSAGEIMTEAEAQSGAYPCELKKWKFSWHGSHSPQVQADFITESYRIFAEKPYVIGAIYYRWDDQDSCWQCERPDCPAETAWGLVDLAGKPKPSYYSLKAALKKHFQE